VESDLKEQFDLTNSRLDQFDGRFETFDERFRQIQTRLDSIDSHLSSSDARFEEFRDFVAQNMVTREQLDERIANLPTKNDFQNLISVIDGYSKQMNDFGQEKIILGGRTSRVETWVKQAAEKIGVEYNP
jgi:endo-1,4-beta-mannosidase